MVVFLFGGTTQSQIDFIVPGLVALGRSVFSAAFQARVLANTVDKSVAVLLEFLAYRWLSARDPEGEAEQAIDQTGM